MEFLVSDGLGIFLGKWFGSDHVNNWNGWNVLIQDCIGGREVL